MDKEQGLSKLFNAMSEKKLSVAVAIFNTGGIVASVMTANPIGVLINSGSLAANVACILSAYRK